MRCSNWCFYLKKEAEYQRAMQRRAIRDAKTPEKMKQAKPVVDDSLTLQGKKDKIKSNLQRLGELGKVHPEKKYQDLINDIAKVPFLCPLRPGIFRLYLNTKFQIRPFHLILKSLDSFVDDFFCRTSGTRGDIVRGERQNWWSFSRPILLWTPRPISTMCRLTTTINTSRPAWTI